MGEAISQLALAFTCSNGAVRQRSRHAPRMAFVCLSLGVGFRLL